MIDTLALIRKYIDPDTKLFSILVSHSRDVANKAVSLTKNKNLQVDFTFIEESAMLHDIGIYKTYAPNLYCFGSYDYLCHGILGRAILEKEGLFRHALVCERHIGSGLTVEDIISQNLPLPKRDMCPVSIEEKAVCFADLFFSKSNPGKEKSIEHVRKYISRYGEHSISRFDEMCNLFF